LLVLNVGWLGYVGWFDACYVWAVVVLCVGVMAAWWFGICGVLLCGSGSGVGGRLMMMWVW